MGYVKTILILGFSMLFLLAMGCSNPEEWQDHIYKDDPILGGEEEALAITWEGEWTMTEWWEQDESGAELEAEDHEGYVIYNPDGTCEFQIFDDDPLEGNYTIIMQVSHSFEDEWWAGPWWVSLDIDDGEMRWFSGDSLLAGEGEGYVFTMEESPTDLYYGEWTMTYWWEQDESGEEVEGEDHEGYVIYNKDGTVEFQIFDDDPLEGLFDFTIKVGHTFGDEWWDGPWIISTLTQDEMAWFLPFESDPDGAGEGYRFERAEE